MKSKIINDTIVDYYYDSALDKVLYNSDALLSASSVTDVYKKKFLVFLEGSKSIYNKVVDLYFCPIEVFINFTSAHKGCSKIDNYEEVDNECLAEFEIKPKEVPQIINPKPSKLRSILNKADLPLYAMFGVEFVMFFITIFTFSKYLVFDSIEDEWIRWIVNGVSSVLLSLLFEISTIIFAVRKRRNLLIANILIQILIVGVHTHLWQQTGELLFPGRVEQIETYVMSFCLTIIIPLCCFFLAELTLEKSTDD